MGFLQPNYNKPGAGVSKKGPKKKEFVRFFEIYTRKFWNLMVANLLYVAVSLPLVTGGLADAGLTRITRSFSQEKFAFIRQDFFDTIRKNWKQALPIGVVNLLLTGLLIFDIYWFYATGEGLGGILLFAGILLASVIFAFMRYYIPLLIITFKLNWKQIYKNAFLLALAGLKRNVVISIVLVLVYALAGWLMWINLAVGLTVSLMMYIFVFPAFRSFLIQFCIFPVVKKYIIDPYYREHPDEDIEKRKDLNLEVESGEEEEESVFEDTLPEVEDSVCDDNKIVIPKQYSSIRDDDDDDTI